MSKEAIIKDLPEPFVRQMRNWVKTASSVGLYCISPAYEGMPGNPTYGPRIPLSGKERTHLERAIESLPNRERLAVRLFWMYEGHDLVWLGNRMRCDYRTAESRVRRGHELVRQRLATYEAACERTESMVQMAGVAY